MTETDWNTCADAGFMLDWLLGEGKLSERKARLFAVACCRRVWHLLNDERSQAAVEVLERWVDGNASLQELADAHELAWQAWGTPARTAASDASAVEFAASRVAEAASHASWAGSGASRADECRAQTDLLRCIFGNPFIPLSPLDLSRLAWNDRTVVRLRKPSTMNVVLKTCPSSPTPWKTRDALTTRFFSTAASGARSIREVAGS